MIFGFIGCMLCLCIMAASVGSVLVAMYLVQVTANDSTVLDLDSSHLMEATIVYAADGSEYAYFTRSENRIKVPLSEMPENLQNAVIAVEDKNFRNEPGINLKRTIAATLNMLTDNALLGSQQGASTLEQQLIKNLTKDDETDALRKVREIFRALGLAKRYSKDTILEAYLNTIPLTGIIHGMQAGANAYFDKDVSELSLAECAVLASISKNPTGYNPFTNPENLLRRRNHVLYEMFDQGYITQSEYDAARNEPLTVVESSTAKSSATRSSNNSWFTDSLYTELRRQLIDDLGYTKEEAQELIFTGGLRIESTVDTRVQAAVEEAMLDEDGLIPAMWHEEPVCLRDYPAETSTWDMVQYDEATGLPITKDGYAVYGTDDVPVYTDETNTELKVGESTDPNYPNDDTVYLCVYEKVRSQASIAVLDYDGNVLGIAGGLGEKTVDMGTNRALLPHQTGSTMKPIGAYCLALDNKQITYSSPVQDLPLYSAADHKVLKDTYVGKINPLSAQAQARDDIWRDWPSNYGNKGGNGDIVLVYDALRQSLNTVAVQLGRIVGVDYLYDFVHDTLECSYIDADNDMDLAPLVLGGQTNGLTAVELAGAYSIFYDGTFTSPHFYTMVTDSNGHVIIDNTKYINTTQAISSDTAYIMNRMMKNVLTARPGTAAGMMPKGEMDAAAKTGTTSNNKDYTFAGLTPYYCTAIWWGFDRPTDMTKYGAGNGSPIQQLWKNLMEELQADLPYKEFPVGENVVEKYFNTANGAITSGGQKGYYTEDNLPEDSYLVQPTATTEPAA